MKLFLVFLILLFTSNCFAQDTLIYYQPSSLPWVSNSYYFHKKNSESSKGTFEKKVSSDDGQRWYGCGTYTDYKHKIVTDTFSLKSMHYHITSRYVSASELTDTKIDTILTEIIPVNSLIFLKKGDKLILKSRRRKDQIVFTRRNSKK